MARSAKGAVAPGGAAALLAAAALAGCSVTTTQQTAARLQVKAARVVASGKATRLGHPDGSVKVVRTSLVRGTDGSAIAVVLENTAKRTVNDLPIGVGVRAANGTSNYLNLAPRTPYFQSHVPAIAAGRTETWVFTSKDNLPQGAPFATVGTPADPPTVAANLPELDVRGPAHDEVKPGKPLRVRLRNVSAIPQYGVEVYVSAERQGRLVAAGNASVTSLGGGDTATVTVPLIGDAQGAAVRVSAPPTIFE